MDGVTSSSNNLYAVLGVVEGCSSAEIKSAYRKLAMKWHPDKCANGDPEEAERSKLKFQKIQEAYSVLGDESKRFWYDAELLSSKEDSEDTNDVQCEKYGMSDFLDEMKAIMRKVRRESKDDSFEDMKDLFQKIIDIDMFPANSSPYPIYGRKDTRQKPEGSGFVEDEDLFQQVFGRPLSDPFDFGITPNASSGKNSRSQIKCPRKRHKHGNGHSNFS